MAADPRRRHDVTLHLASTAGRRTGTIPPVPAERAA